MSCSNGVLSLFFGVFLSVGCEGEDFEADGCDQGWTEFEHGRIFEISFSATVLRISVAAAERILIMKSPHPQVFDSRASD
ncbi:hypothetical protein BJ741DRAFT_589120 [Chytriomyces cf. hyalinus JEL632]|nr:hypothetical protein BJ741DRAFT_589120 [Chytriomyces cf. hyalinus JEL632]